MIKHVFPSLLIASAFLNANAEEISIKAENAVVITFASQPSRTYKVLGTETPEGPWRSLQDGIAGTGGEVTVFYKSASDQKLFFKVEARDGSPARPVFESVARLNLSGQDFSGFQLPGEDFKLFTLTGAIFSNANLRGANLIGAVANRANFAGADLRDILIDETTVFTGANLRGANFEGSSVRSASWAEADLQNARLNRVAFIRTSLAKADLRGAALDGAVFVFADLSEANLSGQNLSNVVFHYSNFYFTDLTGANLAGADLSRSYLRSTKFDNASLANARFEGTIFQYQDLSGRDLRGALLRGAVFEANLSGINAAGVDASLIYGLAPGLGVFLPANLSGANFSGANLEGAVLNGVNLNGVNLRNAKLQGAELRGAILSNADFTGADLSFVEVAGAFLTGATNFNAEAPGLDFGAGTTLPDGTVRTGKNPGVGFAPANVPGRLRFDINDRGAVATRELTFGPNGYSEPGQAAGPFSYTAKGMIAKLGLPTGSALSIDYYTLVFTSATGGKLFKNVQGPHAGVFQIGTFTVLP
jgi:uncharacterized protein YjbI with pentapeptide repeats